MNRFKAMRVFKSTLRRPLHISPHICILILWRMEKGAEPLRSECLIIAELRVTFGKQWETFLRRASLWKQRAGKRPELDGAAEPSLKSTAPQGSVSRVMISQIE